ncbi:hypothetical protein PYCCODRAFT_824608 [Trametes coccinea BRFM310]|uniref:Uncharacterized protein n=1 Tax=Trametes coccinea (strain BRFM310) TaxID=1353009 RepID=A0A1Y2IEX4_TRAC3|nr:hypothetical protein PYCCODRAFT_1036394 [Trametes coccinea BRFM310]OSC99648.1 hypothetical protein PYCCODRAFT_824608 [Trametes coccinea BRFM310]
MLLLQASSLQSPSARTARMLKPAQVDGRRPWRTYLSRRVLPFSRRTCVGDLYQAFEPSHRLTGTTTMAPCSSRELTVSPEERTENAPQGLARANQTAASDRAPLQGLGGPSTACHEHAMCDGRTSQLALETWSFQTPALH